MYAALLEPVNLVGLNTFATHNRSFRTTLFAFFGDVAALPNNNINPQQPNALGVLNALIAANVPFQNVVGNPDIKDCLGMIGSLDGFRFFLMPPPITDSSDHDDDGKHDDDEKDDDYKKNGNGGNSNVGDKLQRVS